MPTYDAVVWLLPALAATGVLAVLTVWRWRRRGAGVGLRWSGLTLVPLALYFTGLWRLTWNVLFDITSWVTGFVFHPTTWVGVVLGVAAVALIVLPRRVARAFGGSSAPPPATRPAARRQVGARAGSGDDDDLAEVTAILRQRGID